MTGSRLRLVVVAAVCGAALCLTPFGTAGAQIQANCLGKTPTIMGGDGNDVLNGTRGNDVIFTGAGRDHVNGGAGNDRICLGTGDDLTNGAAGNDLIDGGLGRDQVQGGAGRDQLNGGPVLLMRWECLRGEWHQVTYDVSSVPARQVDDRNTGLPCDQPPPVPIDRANQLDGDSMSGGPGPDALFGGGGNDGMVGGTGNDRLFGNVGSDVLAGGVGDDQLTGGPVYMTRWECRNNTWHLVTYDVSVTPPREVDDIDTAQPCPEAITPPITPADNDGAGGGPGNDSLLGGYGDDTLLGQGGRDRLRGGSGRDRLHGGPGGDNCRQGEHLRSC